MPWRGAKGGAVEVPALRVGAAGCGFGGGGAVAPARRLPNEGGRVEALRVAGPWRGRIKGGALPCRLELVACAPLLIHLHLIPHCVRSASVGGRCRGLRVWWGGAMGRCQGRGVAGPWRGRIKGGALPCRLELVACAPLLIHFHLIPHCAGSAAGEGPLKCQRSGSVPPSAGLVGGDVVVPLVQARAVRYRVKLHE